LITLKLGDLGLRGPVNVDVIPLRRIAFQSKLKSCVKSLKSCLRRYRTAEECGQWNERIAADLASDSTFTCTIESLHETALSEEFREQVVFDGAPHVCAVDIIFGEQISVSYNIPVLSPTYFETPAQISLRLDNIDSASGTIKYGCGLANRDGGFSTSRRSVVPCNEHEWAVFETLSFNTKILDEWRRRNSSAG